MKKLKLILLLSCILLSTTACNTKNNVKLNILTSVYPIEFIVNQIYEDGITTSIYPDGADIKNYTLTEKQIKEYSKNDIFIYNGLSNELNVAKNLINKNRKLFIIDVAYGLKYDYSTEELWLSPNNFLMLTTTVKENIKKQMTSKYMQEEIETKYKELEETLSVMDAELRSIAKNASQKTIIASSNTFKYLENYGFNVISLEDKATSENTVKNNFKNKIYTTIFMKDTEEKTKFISNLEKTYQANIITVHTMTTLTEEEKNNKEDYLSIMKEYIENIKAVTLGK